MKIFLFFLYSIFSTQLMSQCPLEGNAKTAKEVRMNKNKNRDIKIEKIDTNITLSKLLKSGNDTARFKSTDYASIAGYLVEFKKGGSESCNCNSKDGAEYDIHIYIGRTINAKKEDCLVVEVTPKFKKIYPDINYKSMKGKIVIVTGYLLSDYEHMGNAKNTCVKCTNIWRKTIWEIHPVCEIKLVE
jgi:hypothetical protein